MHTVRSGALVLLISLLCVFPSVTEAAAKKTVIASNAPDPLKEATVNIYCRLKVGKKIFSSSGSGVFVNDRGIILTNAHVAQYLLLTGTEGRVTGWCNARTGSPANERYDVSLLYMPTPWLATNIDKIKEREPKGTGENDFALLYVTKATKGTVPLTYPSLSVDTLGTSIVENAAVSIAGYPTEDLDFDDTRSKLKQTTASSTVTNIRGFVTNQKDVVTLASSAAGATGVSGGPVVNNANAVIGIATTKSTAKDDRTLRAISVPYIDRTLRAQTTVSLSSMLAGDIGTRAAITKASIATTTIDTLRKALIQKK